MEKYIIKLHKSNLPNVDALPCTNALLARCAGKSLSLLQQDTMHVRRANVFFHSLYQIYMCKSSTLQLYDYMN